MLVTVCCAAVCLQLPYTVIYILNMHKESLWPDDRDKAAMYLATRVADLLATSNYAVNFALYFASGSAFRTNVQRIHQCVCDRIATAAVRCVRSP